MHGFQLYRVTSARFLAFEGHTCEVSSFEGSHMRGFKLSRVTYVRF